MAETVRQKRVRRAGGTVETVEGFLWTCGKSVGVWRKKGAEI
jgi:hypothetical protein